MTANTRKKVEAYEKAIEEANAELDRASTALRRVVTTHEKSSAEVKEARSIYAKARVHHEKVTLDILKNFVSIKEE